VFLALSGGPCIFNIDGSDVALLPNGVPPTGDIRLAYRNTSIPAGSHILLISPAHAESLIELDYIIYTYVDPDYRIVACTHQQYQGLT
jgi:hypothetical protein